MKTEFRRMEINLEDGYSFKEESTIHFERYLSYIEIDNISNYLCDRNFIYTFYNKQDYDIYGTMTSKNIYLDITCNTESKKFKNLERKLKRMGL